jgi:hypothetical protein
MFMMLLHLLLLQQHSTSSTAAVTVTAIALQRSVLLPMGLHIIAL